MRDHHVEMHDWHIATLRTAYTGLQNLLVGEPIGDGVSRRVYCYVDPVTEKHTDKVIKFELNLHMQQNVTEYGVWQAVRTERIQKWFAPCFAISSDGRWLIQAKTTPLAPKDRPARLPSFLNDLKDANFGWYKGRIVCHDYGIVLPALARNLKVRMVATKRDWST